MNELYHFNPFHDRKTGRFTDKNGNLTEAGIRRYHEILERDHDNATKFFDTTGVELNKSRAGVVKRNGEEYVKKGSTFTRYTDASEKLDHNRKYVSVTDEDAESYHEVAAEGFLGLKDLNNIKKVQYTATKDLRVASGKAVVDYLLDKYGDTKVTDVADKIKLSDDDLKVISEVHDKIYGGNSVRDVLADKNKFDLSYDLELKNYTGKDRKVLEAAMQYATTRDKIMSNFYAQQLMDSPMKNNPTFRHFAKLGYDAIVDVEDAEWANYPLILLDPVSSVKNKRTK